MSKPSKTTSATWRERIEALEALEALGVERITRRAAAQVLGYNFRPDATGIRASVTGSGTRPSQFLVAEIVDNFREREAAALAREAKAAPVQRISRRYLADVLYDWWHRWGTEWVGLAEWTGAGLWPRVWYRVRLALEEQDVPHERRHNRSQQGQRIGEMRLLQYPGAHFD